MLKKIDTPQFITSVPGTTRLPLALYLLYTLWIEERVLPGLVALPGELLLLPPLSLRLLLPPAPSAPALAFFSLFKGSW